MKVTKEYLKRVIKEELGRMEEMETGETSPESQTYAHVVRAVKFIEMVLEHDVSRETVVEAGSRALAGLRNVQDKLRGSVK